MKAFWSKTKAKYILMGIHALCTILWAKSVFINVGINPSGTVALNSKISDGFEIALTYALTEAFALLFVFLLWNLVFKVFGNFKKKYIPFLIIYLLGAVLILFAWPEILIGLNGADDNVVTFSAGVRLMPDYWHSAYSSIIYAASMLVLPIVFSVTLVQWTFAFYVFSYIFFRAGKNFGNRKYLLFAIVLFPECLMIAANGHRIYQYVIAVLLYFAVIVFDIVEKKTPKAGRISLITLFAAFLSVWRSEGIILGALGLVIYLIYVFGKQIPKALKYLALFACFFVLFSLPQKIGSVKYYGSDYSIYNSFEMLQHTFNDPGADLNYEGAADDLAAIDAVIPTELIRFWGLEGYRRYNYNVRGHADINQTGITSEEAQAFTKAYRRILLHNPWIYAKTQIDKLLYAVGIPGVVKFDVYSDVGDIPQISEWEYCGWENGVNDFFAGTLTKKWAEFNFRQRVARKVLRIRTDYLDGLVQYKVFAGSVLLILVAGAVAFFAGLFGKRKDRLFPGLLCGVILLNFCGVAVAMPVYHAIYLVTSIYPMLLMLFVFFGKKRGTE